MKNGSSFSNQNVAEVISGCLDLYVSVTFYSVRVKVITSVISLQSPSLSEKDQNHLA